MWIAVGYAVSKGKNELGKGGAPPAVAKHLAALNNEYEIASMTLMVMGFNGAMMDCEFKNSTLLSHG